jgi:hypothetical protein
MVEDKRVGIPWMPKCWGISPYEPHKYRRSSPVAKKTWPPRTTSHMKRASSLYCHQQVSFLGTRLRLLEV